MQRNRRLLVGFGVIAVLAVSVWAYKKLTYDDRLVGIDISFAGAKGEWGFSGAILPLYDTYTIGLAFFDVAISARADGLITELKRSDHSLSWPGDLVFYTLEPKIVVPISGSEEVISIYDTTKPAADGAEGPLFVGNLKLTAQFNQQN